MDKEVQSFQFIFIGQQYFQISKELSRICTLHLRRSLCRRHLCDIVFTSVLSVTPCAYYIRLLVYHFIFRKNKKLPIIMRIIESFEFIELKNSIISNTSSNAFQEAYNVLSNQEKKHVEWLFLTKKATSAHTLIGTQKCD